MITTCRLATGVHCLSSKRLWTSLSRWLEEMRVYPIMPCIHPQWQAFISVLCVLLSTGKDRMIVSFCTFHSHCECVCVRLKHRSHVNNSASINLLTVVWLCCCPALGCLSLCVSLSVSHSLNNAPGTFPVSIFPSVFNTVGYTQPKFLENMNLCGLAGLLLIQRKSFPTA